MLFTILPAPEIHMHINTLKSSQSSRVKNKQEKYLWIFS